MIALPDLYPHQEDLRDRSRDALVKHVRAILCAGCGVGKTREAKWMLGAKENKTPTENQSGYSLFVVQGRPLVRNASDSFSEAPELRHGVLMSGEDTAYGCRTQVASIDTMLSWFVEGGEYHPDMTFDFIVNDECEHHFPKFARFLKCHDEARAQRNLHPAYVLGLTATPMAKGLADVYKVIVPGPPTKWLIEQNFLAPFRYFRGTPGKLDKLVLRGGEYTRKSEYAAMDGLSGDLVRDWKRLAEGRPTVGFFPRRSHARDAMHDLEAAGVRVAYVDCETPDESRARIFWQLNNHQIDYLCNVDIVGRGTDIPAIACVQLCVAIGSKKPFIQKVGRGSRVDDGIREGSPDVPAKIDCIVIDHGPNVGYPPHGRHGLFEDDREWSLDISEKKLGEQGTRPTIECPKCSAIYRGGLCSSCGYEPSERERRAKGLEFDGTELKEVKRKEKQPVSVQSAEQLMLRALYMAGKSGRTWRQCCGIYRGLCKKQGTPDLRVPSSITFSGCRYKMVRYGSDNSSRRVADLYPFTVNRGDHSGEYIVQQAPAGTAF